MKLNDAIRRAESLVRMLNELEGADPAALGLVIATAYRNLEALRGERARLLRHANDYRRRAPADVLKRQGKTRLPPLGLDASPGPG